MSTGLWVAAAGLAPGAIAAAVPPACRRPVDAPTALVTDGDDVLAQSPDWRVGGATQLLPSFSALTERPLAMRFELAARIGGAWTPWTAGI
ncbi:MAG TPA: hypothetical protein VFL90_05530, partial [Methylomirabilota bacterium]|nr:hypothetical protein [Methylomirabilota bacterium]